MNHASTQEAPVLLIQVCLLAEHGQAQAASFKRVAKPLLDSARGLPAFLLVNCSSVADGVDVVEAAALKHTKSLDCA